MLNLHAGGEEVPYEMLSKVPTPEATATHFPIAHYRLVDALKHTLGFYGHEVVSETHAVAKEGNRYFGLLSLRSEYGQYEDTVGLRNSNDKSFPIGIAFGGKVFVCSNLSFYGDHVIRRKHTQNAWRDVHGLLAEIIEPLMLQREQQHLTFEKYKATELTDQAADHAIMQLYRREVLNVQRIPEVVKLYEEPPYAEWGRRSVWTLFNSCTAALAGRVAETPALTQKLHEVVDAVCA